MPLISGVRSTYNSVPLGGNKTEGISGNTTLKEIGPTPKQIADVVAAAVETEIKILFGKKALLVQNLLVYTDILDPRFYLLRKYNIKGTDQEKPIFWASAHGDGDRIIIRVNKGRPR